MEIYPKIVITLDTTRTEAQIRSALDDVYPAFKTRLRQMADEDAETTIVAWDYHLSTGHQHDLEP